MITRYLFLDTETGGLDAKNNSLLSLSLLLTDDQGQEISHLDLYMRPDDGVYRVSPDALRINKIDLTDQSEVLSYKQGRVLVTSFLGSFNEGAELIPVGWNLPFDLDFIYEQFMSKQTWQKLLNSYKMIDLAAVWLYLKAMGKVNSHRNRLTDVHQTLFGKELAGAHTSSNDTEATKEVFYALKDYLK